MKDGKWFRPLIYGIRGRFLKYVLVLLGAMLLVSGVSVGIVVYRSTRQAALDKYTYANDRISLTLGEQYKRSDALMRRCIINREFQNSLLSREMTATEKQSLEQLLSYLDMDCLQNYLYVDNKGNLYGKPYQRLTYEDFKASGIEAYLGEEYSKTTWFMAEDSLFYGEGPTLFIGRYIRNMDYLHEPGILLLKMDPDFFDSVLLSDAAGEGIYLFFDQEGMPFYGKGGGKEVTEAWMEKVAACVREEEETGKSNGFVWCGLAGMPGTAIYTRQADTGFYVVTFLPERILRAAVVRMLLLMVLIFAAAAALACVLSVYFSKRFTGPIRQINDAMQRFNAGEEESALTLHTGTELDTIGSSYNHMTEEIRLLLNKVRKQERELHDSELKSLMYQINPHFLYNTLDNIYMLARLNGEELTMRMIQALSKFLKVSLSKGKGVIPVEDELEHVKSYMDIQKIRNNDLFSYEISCEKELLQEKVLKLILQPLVENSIKHGFCEIYEGGLISITVSAEEGFLVFRVWNNGVPISGEAIEQIRKMRFCDYQEIDQFFEGREGGYGVGNVMGRLRLQYGDRMEYYYELCDGGTLCVIRIPQEGKREDEKGEA